MSKPDLKKIEQGYAAVLEGLGLDWRSNPHMQDTPLRAAKAMANELCRHIGQTDVPKMTTFPLKGEPTMIISRHIPVQSLCAHHLLPFTGEATVAYIPRDRVLGLSKLSRAVDFMARRPQVQEQLTSDVADFLVRTLGPEKIKRPSTQGGEDHYTPQDPEYAHAVRDLMDNWGVAVIIRSRHMCMELRGVEHSSDVITSALRGEFNKPEVRAEFLSLAEVNGR